MPSRFITQVGALVALALPVALLQASSAAEAAPSVVLFDQTSTAAPANTDSNAANFAPSNDFGPGSTDRTADDFTVPVGATWAINEIDATGAFSGAPSSSTVNAYLYADAAGKPGAEIFSQKGITTTGAPNFVVPLVGVPSLTAGTYWVTVQFVTSAGPDYWSWATSTVQRGNPAQWRTEIGVTCSSWAARATCWPGTNPDQAFALKGVDLTPSNVISLGTPKLKKKIGTAVENVTVPGAGTLTLSGQGVVPQSGTATGAGSVPLKVKAKGAKKRRLDRTGKVTVVVSVTFTPTGGTANTVTTKIKLRKRVG